MILPQFDKFRIDTLKNVNYSRRKKTVYYETKKNTALLLLLLL